MDKRKTDFQDNHRDLGNILFHIACGMVYISLFFTCFPVQVFLIYSLILLFLFPNPIILFTLPVLFFLRNHILAYKPSVLYVLAGVLIFYFAPELSHYITGEETVLNINTVSALDIIDNFFLLLPYSLSALTSYYKMNP